MNFNILTYSLFFIIIGFITIKVGWTFYKNGEHFIVNLLPDDLHLVGVINKLLLVGYYLLNLGYSALIISTWDTVHNFQELISSLSIKAGIIILGLGLMHYFNLIILNFYKSVRASSSAY